VADCCLANGAEKVYSLDIGDVGDEFASVEKLYPGKLLALHADVTNEESVTRAVDQVIEKEGAVHGMVVNAGRTKHKAALGWWHLGRNMLLVLADTLLDFTKEEIEQLWNVNVSGRSAVWVWHWKPNLLLLQLFGTFYCARVAARAFIKQGIKGSIVFTASMASYRPNKVRPPHARLYLLCADTGLPSASPRHPMEHRRPAFGIWVSLSNQA